MSNRRASRKLNTAASRRKLRKQNVFRTQSHLDVDTYHGLFYEDFVNMTLEEILTYMSSSVRRFYNQGLKGVNAQLFNRLLIEDFSTEIRTHARSFYLLPIHVGRRIHVHNGKSFVPVNVTISMSGRRLGEFALTRIRPVHKSPGIGASRSSKARATAKT